MIRILLVCMGNICRSPTAEGVLRYYLDLAGLAKEVEVTSAGTHGYHTGEAPDPRACSAAQRRGYDLSRQRAKRVGSRDFARYDMILAMDRDNLAVLELACPREYHTKLDLFTHYATRHRDEEVPDPFYGGPDGFERVLDIIEDAAEGLAERLRLQLRAA